MVSLSNRTGAGATAASWDSGFDPDAAAIAWSLGSGGVGGPVEVVDGVLRER